jgi:hypothetical protein
MTHIPRFLDGTRVIYRSVFVGDIDCVVVNTTFDRLFSDKVVVQLRVIANHPTYPRGKRFQVPEESTRLVLNEK